MVALARASGSKALALVDLLCCVLGKWHLLVTRHVVFYQLGLVKGLAFVVWAHTTASAGVAAVLGCPLYIACGVMMSCSLALSYGVGIGG